MPYYPTIGQSYPLGATVFPEGVNFSVFSKNATSVELLLFDQAEDAKPRRVIPLNHQDNRTFYYWHVFVPGIRSGQLYAYRVYGPFKPSEGLRFDGSKLLLDPYTRAVAVSRNYSRKAAARSGDNCSQAMKSVVVDVRGYDWEGDQPLKRPYSESILYEIHVGGFTRHPSSGIAPELRGTFSGLVEKIPYLQRMGVTGVELLPIAQFDEQDARPPLSNYWGYNPVAFFAPHSGYASSKVYGAVVDEFRDMVKAFHQAGIEVILDVVFNHTGENDENGPTLSFRGLENRAYYLLEANRALYSNYSGCGNTLKTNHSIVRRLILDSLRYWVSVMHVDGFRFDLASVLSRGESGEPLESPPILWEIESDPVLAGTKIIAEAWDATGLYQVGSFVGHRWAEWNGPFRDDLRRFMRGENGTIRSLANRIVGSPDLYPQEDREPNRSINFITCHDGFTLYDLVSYNQKHNEANREGNRDGTNDNYSWNCGEEGPSDDPQIEALRQRQIKNFLSVLFISQGTPMLSMGDEIRRTQHGNNNVYCQDNDISWFNWENVEKQAGLLRFVRGMIRFTQSCAVFREEVFWNHQGESPHITWHGVRLNQPDWSHTSHSLAFTLHSPDCGNDIQVLINSYWELLDFELPPAPAKTTWKRIVDTSLPAPDDFCEPPAAPEVNTITYPVQPRSVVILIS